jgi:hypothetical protein
VEISFNTISQAGVNVVIDLRDLHEYMNEVEEPGAMDHYMETCNDYIFVSLETIIDWIPPKMELFEYNVPVMGIDSTSPRSNVNNPTYIFITVSFSRHWIE